MIKISLSSKCSSVLSPINYNGDLNFYTDTRKYTHPGAFVAIPGEKTNPLDVLDSLLIQEIPIVFYQKNEINQNKIKILSSKYPITEFVPVSDSIEFLQEISHEHILNWKKLNPRNKIFAISGSNGKTTHKEMLAFILKEVFPGRIVSTEKNNNNHLGVPLTLLNVSNETQMVVLELGSNHPGEIKLLCEIAAPDCGITTNIGATHMEFFGSEEKVFHEEAYLYYAIKEISKGTGFYLINLDDNFLKNLTPTTGSITYGENSEAQARIEFLSDGAQLFYQDKKYLAINKFITGQHNKLNLITCLFIASYLFPEKASAFETACTNFVPTKNRSEWISFEDRSVYLDAYNANPSSMKAALSGFKESVLAQGLNLEDACLVLGDMNELGELTAYYHEEVAKFVLGLGFINVYFVGRYAQHYLKGFPGGKVINSCTEFKHEYRSQCIFKYAIHFIKGSRSLQLESLFDIK